MLPTLRSHHSGHVPFDIGNIHSPCPPSSTISSFCTHSPGDDPLLPPTLLSNLHNSPLDRRSFTQLDASFHSFHSQTERLHQVLIPFTSNHRRRLSSKMRIHQIHALIFALVGPWQVTAQREHRWSTFDTEIPTTGMLHLAPGRL